MESLIKEWEDRKMLYDSIIDLSNKKNGFNNIKFTYKSMATRDCIKDLRECLKNNEAKSRQIAKIVWNDFVSKSLNQGCDFSFNDLERKINDILIISALGEE